MSEDAGGRVHFRPTKDYGHLIKPGFSGAPVFADDTNTVIGMIIAVQTGDGSRVAYGEPVRRLHMAWPQMARPYKGLARFDPEDAELFFGREEIVAELLERVERDPVTLVVGASGGGKSSVVFGGVLPRLDEAQWRVASFRPGSEPIKNLAWPLASVVASPGDPGQLMARAEDLQRGLMGSPDKLFGIGRAVRHTAAGARLLLVIDQFEELFTLGRDSPEQEPFIKVVEAIGRQVEPASVKLIATLRDDFLGRVLRSVPLSGAFDKRHFPLRAMNGAELGRAIRIPAASLCVGFEPGVADNILASVAKDADALPLMEFALERLWAEQDGRLLTHAAYEKMGGLEGALALHADDVFNGMGEAEQAILRRLLCRLVTVVRPGEGEDTKRPQSREDIGEELWVMAQRMAGHGSQEGSRSPARLIVAYRDEQGRDVVDIIHEALIRHWPRLKGWLDEERSFRVLADDFLRARRRWVQDKAPHRLLRGRDLDEALEYRERLVGEYPELVDFVDASSEGVLLDEADRKADAIWERVELFRRELSVRERDALRELATSDDRVRRAFLRRLYDVPDRARRFCRLPGPVVRAAIGLRA
ncbi:MAG TPA: hypothetical protein VLI93_05675, partial [Acetobacteraceae bacterium]|nr:hypothetical protein [Acetobacteraceae bacterium]